MIIDKNICCWDEYLYYLMYDYIIIVEKIYFRDIHFILSNVRYYNTVCVLCLRSFIKKVLRKINNLIQCNLSLFQWQLLFEPKFFVSAYKMVLVDVHYCNFGCFQKNIGVVKISIKLRLLWSLKCSAKHSWVVSTLFDDAVLLKNIRSSISINRWLKNSTLDINLSIVY